MARRALGRGRNPFDARVFGRRNTDELPRIFRRYALGSRIVEAYYAEARDKKQAVKDILSVTDYPRVLKKSRYAARFSLPSGSDGRP